MTIKYDSKFKKGLGDFYALEGKKEVSHLRIDFLENNFPYVLSMHTLEKYRNKRIMENLLKYANNFYVDVTGENLRFSRSPDEGVKGYLEKLEKKGLVKKVKNYRRKDFGRWIFK